jgi:hypothetical protein
MDRKTDKNNSVFQIWHNFDSVLNLKNQLNSEHQHKAPGATMQVNAKPFNINKGPT